MSSINSRVPPLRLMAVDTPTDGQLPSYQSSSGKFEWVDEASGGSPGGTSGSIQYNDGAGGFAGSTKMVYDDTNAKITLTSGGNTTFIDAAGSPQLSFDGTGTGNIPTIAGDGGEVGGTGLLFLGNNSVSNNYMWFNKIADQIQIIAPSSSESIKINSDNGGNVEITATNGSQDIVLSAASGNVKIEGLSYPTSDGTSGQVIQTNGSGVLSFTDVSASPAGSDGDFQINNSGSFGGSILSTNKTTTITLNSGASGDPQISMTSDTKSITLLCDTNQKLKVEGGVNSFVFDASSATGGITWPDGTTQTSASTATIGGSIANTQVAYGSGTDTIQGSANLTFDGTNLDVAGYVKSGTGVYDTNGATDLTLQTNSGTNSGTIVIRDGAAQDIEITPNGAGVINLDGLKWPTADGTANQVLATDGLGTLSFTDSGGGGSTLITPEFPASDTLWSMPSELLGAAGPFSYIGEDVITRQWANGTTRLRPHIFQQGGTLDKVRAWINAAPTGTANQDVTIALWNADTNGGVGTLKAQCTITVTTTDTAPAIIEGSWSAETGQDLSVSIGEIMWVGWYGTYSSTSTATTFYFIRADDIVSLSRRDNNNTGQSSAIQRFYSSTSGSPSTLGDNPTIDKGDGNNSGSGVWPFLWYTVGA